MQNIIDEHNSSFIKRNNPHSDAPEG